MTLETDADCSSSTLRTATFRSDDARENRTRRGGNGTDWYKNHRIYDLGISKEIQGQIDSFIARFHTKATS